MKTLLFIMLLFTPAYFCQGLNTVEMSLTFYSNYGRTEVNETQKPREFITGALFSNKEPRFIGSGEAFLKVLPVNYQKRKSDFLSGQEDTSAQQNLNLYSSSLAEEPDKILRYSFYIESFSDNMDSINVYSKYILYIKQPGNDKGIIEYNASLHDAFFSLPLNRSAGIQYLDDVFPEADSIVVLFKLAGSNPETPRLDMSDYSLDIKSISPGVRDGNSDKLNFTGEYIRTNKEGTRILLRKNFKFSAEKNIIYSRTDNSLVFPMTVNWGFASVPYDNYNPVNDILFKKSDDYSKSRIDFNIMLLPTGKENKLYTFNLFIKRYILAGGYTYSKTIRLKKGEKLRIDLDDAAGIYRHEVMDGKDFYINVKKDYSDYVKEYLILTLK